MSNLKTKTSDHPGRFAYDGLEPVVVEARKQAGEVDGVSEPDEPDHDDQGQDQAEAAKEFFANAERHECAPPTKTVLR